MLPGFQVYLHPAPLPRPVRALDAEQVPGPQEGAPPGADRDRGGRRVASCADQSEETFPTCHQGNLTI